MAFLLLLIEQLDPTVSKQWYSSHCIEITTNDAHPNVQVLLVRDKIHPDIDPPNATISPTTSVMLYIPYAPVILAAVRELELLK